MKLAYYIKKESLKGEQRVEKLLSGLDSAGMFVYELSSEDELQADTDIILSLGGDGTFLSAAHIAAMRNIPVMGVHFGRLGFLSEYSPEQVLDALVEGSYTVEERALLEVRPDCEMPKDWDPIALNECCVSRQRASMLGVDVAVNGRSIPTYWADGLIVATSTGSTAYSLSVGGPICTPDTSLLIIAPVSPHNLNLRPLIVPRDSEIDIVPHSREGMITLSLDNRSYQIPEGVAIHIGPSQYVLKRLCCGSSNFFDALRSRLLWGADIRNN